MTLNDCNASSYPIKLFLWSLVMLNWISAAKRYPHVCRQIVASCINYQGSPSTGR